MLFRIISQSNQHFCDNGFFIWLVFTNPHYYEWWFNDTIQLTRDYTFSVRIVNLYMLDGLLSVRISQKSAHAKGLLWRWWSICILITANVKYYSTGMMMTSGVGVNRWKIIKRELFRDDAWMTWWIFCMLVAI